LKVKNPGPEDPALSHPSGEGSRLKAQGTRQNKKRKLIFSLCLAPYALCLMPYALNLFCW